MKKASYADLLEQEKRHFEGGVELPAETHVVEADEQKVHWGIALVHPFLATEPNSDVLAVVAAVD